MADTDRDKFDGALAALRGFLDCCDGSEEVGMVCADMVLYFRNSACEHAAAA